MPLDPLTAIEIGKAAGLNLSDCRALAALADDEASAKQIAAQFVPEKPKPITRADLKSMDPSEILEAKISGKLEHLLNPSADTPEAEPAEPETPPTVPDADQGKHGPRQQGQLTRDDLARMSTDQIVQADREGRLDKLQRKGQWKI